MRAGRMRHEAEWASVDVLTAQKIPSLHVDVLSSLRRVYKKQHSLVWLPG